jgi:hypothetical protein
VNRTLWDSQLSVVASSVVVIVLALAIAWAGNSGVKRQADTKPSGDGTWIEMPSVDQGPVRFDGVVQVAADAKTLTIPIWPAEGSPAIDAKDLDVSPTATEVVTKLSSGVLSVDHKSLAIMVTTIPAPGVYAAHFTVKGTPYSFTIISKTAGTNLQPLGSGSVNHVQCSTPFDTLLATALFGRQSTDNELQILYSNPAAATLAGGSTVLQAIPEAGQTLTRAISKKDNATLATTFNAVAPSGIAWDSVNIDALELDPGKWTIRSNHAQPSGSVKNDIQLTLRPAPWLPVLLIVIGVVLGLAFKSLSSPRSVLLLELQSIIEQSDNLASATDKRFMMLATREILTRLAASPNDPALPVAADALQKDLGFLMEIENLENTPNPPANFQSFLAQAREAIVDRGDIAGAEAAIASARGLLSAPAAPLTLKRIEASAGPPPAGAGAASPIKPIIPVVPDIFWLRVGKSFIAPVTIAGLCVLGIKLLYVDAVVSGTFPSAVVLVFWGMSSNVAGKTISNMFS